jgi:hypothetical protein
MYGAKELGQDPLKTILFPALSERQFKIESIDGKIKVSTQIHDLNDNLIVELDRNEWKVGPSAFDRNFTDDTLEVRDSSGAVVLVSAEFRACEETQKRLKLCLSRRSSEECRWKRFS